MSDPLSVHDQITVSAAQRGDQDKVLEKLKEWIRANKTSIPELQVQAPTTDWFSQTSTRQSFIHNFRYDSRLSQLHQTQEPEADPIPSPGYGYIKVGTNSWMCPDSFVDPKAKVLNSVLTHSKVYDTCTVKDSRLTAVTLRLGATITESTVKTSGVVNATVANSEIIDSSIGNEFGETLRVSRNSKVYNSVLRGPLAISGSTIRKSNLNLFERSHLDNCKVYQATASRLPKHAYKTQFKNGTFEVQDWCPTNLKLTGQTQFALQHLSWGDLKPARFLDAQRQLQWYLLKKVYLDLEDKGASRVRDLLEHRAGYRRHGEGWVHEDAKLKGSCEIREGAVVGPYVTLQNTTVADYAQVRASRKGRVLLRGCFIGQEAVVESYSNENLTWDQVKIHAYTCWQMAGGFRDLEIRAPLCRISGSLCSRNAVKEAFKRGPGLFQAPHVEDPPNSRFEIPENLKGMLTLRETMALNNIPRLPPVPRPPSLGTLNSKGRLVPYHSILLP